MMLFFDVLEPIKKGKIFLALSPLRSLVHLMGAIRFNWTKAIKTQLKLSSHHNEEWNYHRYMPEKKWKKWYSGRSIY
jgi:hypothetical protein